MNKKYRFGLRLKLVLLVTVLAIVTYACSAFFIFLLYDYINDYLAMSLELFTITTLLLGIIWSGILAFFAAALIIKPLRRLEEAAGKVADGNLNQTVKVPKSDDEIRSLAIAFQRMLENLHGVVGNMESNFTSTNQSVLQMKQISTTATNQTEQISATVNEISQGAENSSIAIQNTAESIEAATELAGDVQQKAGEAKENAGSMLHTLNNSKKVVNQLVEGIHQITSEQELTLNDVNRLKENAQQVETIITMVGEIAEQTNLLALNASIEAARAGEYGKGFAVVAEEIRKLADESKQAVSRISDLTTTIQSEVAHVVTRINQNVAQTQKESEVGEETRTAIEQMSHSVVSTADEIDAISVLVDKQLHSIEDTVRQSQEVAAIAEETSAGAEEVNAAMEEQVATISSVDRLAENIEDESAKLNADMGHFKV